MVINEGFSKIEVPSSCVDTNPSHSPIGLAIWERWRGWKILSFNECLRWKSEIFGITRRRWQLWCSYDNFTSLQTWFLSVQHRGPSSLHRATGFLSTSPGVTSSLWIHRKSDYFTIGSSILIRSHFATFQICSGWSPPPRLCILTRKHQSVVLIDIRGNTWKIFILHAGNPNISVISSQ